jgi:hypothetical protein
MTIDDIEALISKHGSITAQPLKDLVVTVVLEAIEAEREACAQTIERKDLVVTVMLEAIETEREACAQTIERARLRLGVATFVVDLLAAAVRKRGEQE